MMKMSLEEELAAIDHAENAYEVIDHIGLEHSKSESENPVPLAQISGEFMILQHPYAHAIKELGAVLQRYALEPSSLTSSPNWEKYESNSAEILREGGSLSFDRRGSKGWISLVSEYIPENFTGQVSDRAWEVRLIDYAKQIAEVVQKALKLADDHPDVGMMHEELKDLGAYAQAYHIGKTKGIEELRKVAPDLAQGRFLQDYIL